MIEYTAGFLFFEDQVLLVRKRKPAWQLGLLNGIGGKTNPGEIGLDCIRREFKEETGIEVVTPWRLFAVEVNPCGRVEFFANRVSGERPVTPATNDVGELLGWVPIADLFHPTLDFMGNLRWLIPLALDWRECRVHITMHGDISQRPSW